MIMRETEAGYVIIEKSLRRFEYMAEPQSGGVGCPASLTRIAEPSGWR